MGKKPPKLALEGNKWAIVRVSHQFLPTDCQLKISLQEHQENEAALTVENTELNHIINMFGCKNSTIIIKGKINAVTIGECLEYISEEI